MANKRKRKGKDAARNPQPPRKRLTAGPHQASKRANPDKQSSNNKIQGGQNVQSTPSKQTIVPFEKGDHILLVGEGDFSFAKSLHKHHGHRFASLTATTLESRNDLLEKHPQAEQTIADITAPAQPQPSPNKIESSPADEDDSDNDNEDCSSEDESPAAPAPATVHYNIDATRLQTYPALRKRRPRFTKIVFNFPHVGGRSTDVNRQVRANQALVHGYFEASTALLLQSANSTSTHASSDSRSDGGDSQAVSKRTPARSIIVTLFEGEPYSLWNVRDLARSVGLVVRRSWAFDAAVYPGYRHARTLGNLVDRRGGDARDGDGDGDGRQGVDGGKKKKERWRGEERSARMYEFGLRERRADENGSGGGGKGVKRKRKREGREGESSGSE